MKRTTEEYLGRQIAQLKAEIKKLQTGRLRNSSLHGSALPVYDDNDVLKTIVGRQADGSYGVIPRNSGHQPTPTAAILTAGTAAYALAEWDGNVTAGSVPEVHGHIQVFAAHWPKDAPRPLFEDAKLFSSIRDRDGGATTLALGLPGRWLVWLRMVGADRVSVSEPSESAEVTVTSQVDTEEIEKALKEAERERQEYLEEFDRRTAEYEARMAENEDALAAADAWAASSMYKADVAAAEAASAKVDASEAASRAQGAQQAYDEISNRVGATEEEVAAALQAARDAHASAGAAEQYAASVMERVDGINGIISDMPATGEGVVEGQLWEQYDSMGPRRRLQAAWRWSEAEGVWAAVELSTTYLPMADISRATITDLRTQRLFAEIGEVQRLLVGDGTNLLPESALWELRDNGAASDMWAGSLAGWTTIPNTGGMPVALRWNGGDNERLVYRTGSGVRGIPVKPGYIFRMSWYGWKAGSTEASFIRPRYMDVNGDFAGWGPIKRFANGWAEDSFTWTVPDDESIRSMEIAFEGRGDSTERGHWGEFEFNRAQSGELTVQGLLQADRSVVREQIAETTSAQTALFELVRAGLIEADEALIGGVLLKEDALTAPHLRVTEDFAAKLARVLHLVAGEVEMNTFIADSGMVRQLNALGMTLEDEAAGRTTEVGGQGLQIIDTSTGEPITQLGLHEDDFFSLTDEEGRTAVTIQRSGLVAGQVLASESDPIVGGRQLLGRALEFPGAAGTNAVLDSYPRGVVAQLVRPFTETTSTGREITVGYLQAHLFRGRLYRLKCEPFVMHQNTAGAEVLVYQTTAEDDWPVMPTSSTGWNRGPQGGAINASGEPELAYETLIRPETDLYFRCIFVVRRTAGSSVQFLNWSRGTAHMMIEDIGEDMNHTGKPLFRTSNITTDVGTSESLTVTATPAQGQTYQASSSTASSFTSTSPEARHRHGYWDADFMPQPTHYLAGFRFADSASQIGDREVISAEWRVFVDAWALKTIGDQVRPGVRIAEGTLPSSMNPSTVEWLDILEGRLPGRWASIPVPDEHLQAAIDGTAQLVLGRPSTTRRGGAATPADGVQLVFRVTQT